MDGNFKKTVALIGGGVAMLLVFMFSGKIFENNDGGIYQVKQGLSGEMAVRFEPGLYLQGFATLTDYKASPTLEFGKGENAEEAILVRFQDGGTAKVSGLIKVRLSPKESTMLTIHKEFRSHETLLATLLKPTFVEAVQQTAALMKSEESYSTRRSEFAAILEEQVKRGIFEVTASEVKEKDVDGNEFNDVNLNIKTDANGRRLIRKVSPFNEYGVEVIQVIVKDIDYDETIDALIQKKKEAEQQRVVAKANSEKAKQDAITAREQAAAAVAVAKGEEEVEKIKAVTQAEKDYAVAVLSRKKQEELSAAAERKGRAEAEINRLKVNAGLTPQEKAEYQMKTAIGVAEKMSNIKLPSTMVFGGGNGNGSAMDPWTAVGLKSFMDITDKISNDK